MRSPSHSRNFLFYTPLYTLVYDDSICYTLADGLALVEDKLITETPNPLPPHISVCSLYTHMSAHRPTLPAPTHVVELTGSAPILGPREREGRWPADRAPTATRRHGGVRQRPHLACS